MIIQLLNHTIKNIFKKNKHQILAKARAKLVLANVIKL